jgi:adhesin transport system outer membrane protein
VSSARPPRQPAGAAGFTDKLPAEKEVLRQAVTSNPGFRAAVSNIRSSRANIDVQRANYSPTVEFRANTGMDKNLLGVTGETYSSAMQVLLNWNLFKGGADEARIRQSHEQLYNATDLRDKACRDIRQQTAIAWNDIKKLKEQLGYLEQHQLSTEKARDAYRQQFDIGQRSLLDVLNTENELFEAKRASARARYDLTQAELRVLTQTHRILPSMQLASVAKQGPEEAGATEPAEDETLQCSTELPGPAPRHRSAPCVAAPSPRSCRCPRPCRWRARLLAPASGRHAGHRTPRQGLGRSLDGKDVKTYLSFYSPRFKPEQGSLAAWTKQRTQRIEKASNITVEVDKLNVRASPRAAEAQFIQRYGSKRTRDVMNKTLQYELENGQWKIVRESNR